MRAFRFAVAVKKKKNVKIHRGTRGRAQIFSKLLFLLMDFYQTLGYTIVRKMYMQVL